MDKFKKSSGGHSTRRTTRQRNRAFFVKVTSVVVAVLLVFLLIPIGALNYGTLFATTDAQQTASDDTLDATGANGATDSTADQTTETSTEAQAPQATEGVADTANLSTETSTNTQSDFDSSKYVKVLKSDGTTELVEKEKNDEETFDTTIDYDVWKSQFGSNFIRSFTASEPIELTYPDVDIDMYGISGTPSWTNYTSLQGWDDDVSDKGEIDRGFHSRTSSVSCSNGNYIAITPHGDLTRLKIPVSAMSVYKDGETYLDYPVVYVTKSKSSASGEWIFGKTYDVKSTGTGKTADTSLDLDFTTLPDKCWPAGKTFYIFANDKDGGEKYADGAQYGGIRLNKFQMNTSTKGVIGSISKTVKEATVTVSIMDGTTEVAKTEGIKTSTTDSTSFVVNDISLPSTAKKYKLKITADGFDTIEKDIPTDRNFTESIDVGEQKLELSPLDISGKITAKSGKKTTPTAIFYKLNDDGTNETIEGTVSGTAPNFTYTFKKDGKGQIQGGSSGLLSIRQQDGSNYFSYYGYVDNILTSLNDNNIDFSSQTSKASCALEFDKLITATTTVNVVGSSNTVDLSLPSGISLPSGTKVVLTTESVSDQITNAYTDGTETGKEIISDRKDFKLQHATNKLTVTNPSYEWEFTKGEPSYVEEKGEKIPVIQRSNLANTEYICKGKKFIIVEGDRKTISESHVATYQITKSPTNSDYGRILYTAQFTKTDKDGKAYFSTQTSECYLAKEAGSHTHDGVTFEPWTSSKSLPSTSGNYYLADDVEVSSGVTISSGMTLNLCLNGHQIKYTGDSGTIFTNNGGTLGIYDCQAGMSSYRHYFNPSSGTKKAYSATDTVTSTYVDGGVITGGKNSAIVNSGKGTLNIYGGAFVGNQRSMGGHSTDTPGGGAIMTVGSLSTSTSVKQPYSDWTKSSKTNIVGKKLGSEGTGTSGSSFGSQYSVMFAGNCVYTTSNAGGGAIAVAQAALHVTNCLFENNYSYLGTNRDTMGGAIYTYYCPGKSKVTPSATTTYDDYWKSSAIAYDNVDFYRNEASGKGGASFIEWCLDVYMRNVNCKYNKCSVPKSSSYNYVAWGGGFGVNHNSGSSGFTDSTPTNLVFDGSVVVQENLNMANKYGSSGVSDNVSLERHDSGNTNNAAIILCGDFDASTSSVGVNSYVWKTGQEGPYTGHIVDTSYANSTEWTNGIQAFTEDQVLNVNQHQRYAIVVRTSNDKQTPTKTGDFFIVPHEDTYNYTGEHTTEYDGYNGNNDTMHVKSDCDSGFSYTESTSGTVFIKNQTYRCKYSLNPLNISASAEKTMVYDGKTHPVTVIGQQEAEDQILASVQTVTYYKKSGQGYSAMASGEVPKEAGTYYARVLLNEEPIFQTSNKAKLDHWGNSKTEEERSIYSREFTITPRPVNVKIYGETRQFDGSGYARTIASSQVETTYKEGSTTEIDPNSGVVLGETLDFEATGDNYSSKLSTYGSTSPANYNEYVTINDDGSRPKDKSGKELTPITYSTKLADHVDCGLVGATASNYEVKGISGEIDITPYEHDPYLRSVSMNAGSVLEVNTATTFNWFDKGKNVAWSPSGYVQHTSDSDPWLTFKPIKYEEGKTTGNHYTYMTDEELKAVLGKDTALTWSKEANPRAGYKLTTTPGYFGDLYLEVSWDAYDANADGVGEYTGDYLPWVEPSASILRNQKQVIKISITDGSKPALSLQAFSDPEVDANVYNGKTIKYGFIVENNGSAPITNNIKIRETSGRQVVNLSTAQIAQLQVNGRTTVGLDAEGNPTGDYYYQVTKDDESADGILREFQAYTPYEDYELTSNVARIHHNYKAEPVSLEAVGYYYDGASHTGIYNQSYSREWLEERISFEGAFDAIDAGTYKFKATPKDGYCWEDGTIAQKEFTWDIKARILELAPDNASYVFDNDLHTLTAAHITDRQQTGLQPVGLVEGENFNLSSGWLNRTSGDLSNKNVGTYSGYGVDKTKVKVAKSDGKDSTNNYDIQTLSTGVLVITPATATITIKANEKNVKYNGGEQINNEVEVIIPDEWEGILIANRVVPVYKADTTGKNTNFYASKGTNVGVYQSTLEATWQDSLYYNFENEDARANISISFAYVDAAFTISPKPITDIAKPGETGYDESGWITLDYSATSVVYDGKAHSLDTTKVVLNHYRKIDGKETLVRTLTKGSDGDVTISAEGNKVDAGLYKATVLGNNTAGVSDTKHNYSKEWGFDWEISKPNVTVKVQNDTKSYPYDGKDHSLIPEFEGIVSGQSGTVGKWNITEGEHKAEQNNNVQKNVGTLKGSAIKDNCSIYEGDHDVTSNYNITVKEGYIKVTPLNIGDQIAVNGIATYMATPLYPFDLENADNQPGTVYEYSGNPANSGYTIAHDTTPSKNCGVVTADGTELVYGTDYVLVDGTTEESIKGTDAKDYSFKVKGINNYAGTASGKTELTIPWTIQKAWFYVLASVSTTQEALGESATTYEYKYECDSDSRSIPGGVFYSSIYPNSGDNAKNNYSKLPTGQKLIGSEKTVLYDPKNPRYGADTRVNGYYCEAARVQYNKDCGIYSGAAKKNYVTITGTTESNEVNDLTSNYEIIDPTVAMRITTTNEVKIDITPKSTVATYDGEEHKVEVTENDFGTVASTPITDQDTVTVTYEGDGTTKTQSVSQSQVLDGNTYLNANLFKGKANHVYDRSKDTYIKIGATGHYVWTFYIGNFKVVYTDNSGNLGTPNDFKGSVSVNANQPYVKINPKEVTVSPDTSATSTHVNTNPTTSKEKTYDETALSFNTDEYSANNLLTYDSKQHQLTATWKDDYTKPVNYTSEAVTVNPISSVKITGKDAGNSSEGSDLTLNYKITYADGSLKVNQRDISYGYDDGGKEGKGSTGTYEIKYTGTDPVYYNGTPQTREFTVDGQIRKDTNDRLQDSEFKIDLNQSGTNVGTYTTKVTGQGNFKGTIEKTWTLSPRTIKVKPVDVVHTYDANEVSPTQATLESGDLAEGDSLARYLFKPNKDGVTKWPINVIDAPKDKPFESTIVSGSVVIKNGAGTEVQNNYTITYGTGTIIINPLPIDPPEDEPDDVNKFELSLTSMRYSGKTQTTTPTLKWTHINDDKTETVRYLSFKADGSGDFKWNTGKETDANTKHEAKDHNVDQDYTAWVEGTNNFTKKVDGLSGQWNITRVKATAQPIDGTSFQKSWTYNGKSDPYTTVKFQHEDESGVMVDGLVNGEANKSDGYAVTFSANNKQKNVTNGVDVIVDSVDKIALEDKSVTSTSDLTPTTNYTWEKPASKIIIKAADIGGNDFEGVGPTFNYNAIEHELTLNTFIKHEGDIDPKAYLKSTKESEFGQRDLTDAEFVIDTSSVYKKTDAGNYKVKVKGVGNFTGEREIDWYIKPVNAEIKMIGKTYTYDGSAKSLEIQYSGFVDGQTVTVTSFKDKSGNAIANSQTNAGTYNINPNTIVIKQGSTTIAESNYNITRTGADLIIKGIDISKWDVTDAVSYYSGGTQNAFDINYHNEEDTDNPNHSASIIIPAGTVGAGNALVLSKDFKAEESAYKQSDYKDGGWSIPITGIGNYTGTNNKMKFYINKSKLYVETYEAMTQNSISGDSYTRSYDISTRQETADSYETWQSAASNKGVDLPGKQRLKATVQSTKADGTTSTKDVGWYLDNVRYPKETSEYKKGIARTDIKIYESESAGAKETTGNYEITYKTDIVIRSNDAVSINLSTQTIEKVYDGLNSEISFKKNQTAEELDWAISKFDKGGSSIGLNSANIKYIGKDVSLKESQARSTAYEATLNDGALTKQTANVWKNSDFEITLTGDASLVSAVQLNVTSPSIKINPKELNVTPYTEMIESGTSDHTRMYKVFDGETMSFAKNGSYTADELVTYKSQKHTTQNVVWNSDGANGVTNVNDCSSKKPAVTSLQVYGTDDAHSTAAVLNSNYSIKYNSGSYKMKAINEQDLAKSVAENNVYDGLLKTSGLEVSSVLKKGKTLLSEESGDFVIDRTNNASIEATTQSHLTDSKYKENGYPIHITNGANGNYDFTNGGKTPNGITIYWKVAPRPLTVTGKNVNVEYDGFSHKVSEATFAYDNVESLKKHTYTCNTFNIESGKSDPIEVKDSGVKYTPELKSGNIVYNGSSVDLANFDIDYVPGTVTIYACDLSKHYTLAASDMTYNGKKQNPDTVVTRKTTEQSGIDYNSDIKVLTFGEDYTWVSDKVAAENGISNEEKDYTVAGFTAGVTGMYNSNFDTSKFITDPWRILQVDVTVTPNGKTFTYDSLTKSLDSVTFTDTATGSEPGLVNGEKVGSPVADYVTLSNNSQVNKGDYTVAATAMKKLLTQDGKDTPVTNYNWTYGSATLKINPRNISYGYDDGTTPGKKGGDGTYEGLIQDIFYDGNEHIINNSTFSTLTDKTKNNITGLLYKGAEKNALVGTNDHEFKVTDGITSATDANIGDSKYYVEVTGQNNYTGTIRVEWKIKPKEINATLTDVVVMYDSFEHHLANPTVTGMVSGTVLSPDKWTVENIEGNEITTNSRTESGKSELTLEDGNVSYTLNGKSIAKTNYELTCNTAILQVKPISFKPDPEDPDQKGTWTFTDGKTTYNGNMQYATVGGTVDGAYDTTVPFAGNATYTHTAPSAVYTFTYTDASGVTQTKSLTPTRNDYTIDGTKSVLKSDKANAADSEYSTHYPIVVNGKYTKTKGTGISNFVDGGEMGWYVDQMPVVWYGMTTVSLKSLTKSDHAYIHFNSNTYSRSAAWFGTPIGKTSGYIDSRGTAVDGQLPEGVEFTLGAKTVDRTTGQNVKKTGYFCDGTRIDTIRDLTPAGEVVLCDDSEWKPQFKKTTGNEDLTDNYNIVQYLSTINVNDNDTLTVDINTHTISKTYDATESTIKFEKDKTGGESGNPWTAKVYEEGTTPDVKVIVQLGSSKDKTNYVTANLKGKSDKTLSATDAGLHVLTGDNAITSVTGYVQVETIGGGSDVWASVIWNSEWAKDHTKNTDNADFILSHGNKDASTEAEKDNFENQNQELLKKIGAGNPITIAVSAPSIDIKQREVDVTPDYKNSTTKKETYDGKEHKFENDEVKWSEQSGDTGLLTAHKDFAKVTLWDNNSITNVMDPTARQVKNDDGSYHAEKDTIPTAAEIKDTAAGAEKDYTQNYKINFKQGMLWLDQCDITPDPPGPTPPTPPFEPNFELKAATNLQFNNTEQGGFSIDTSATGKHTVVGTLREGEDQVVLDYKNGATDGDFDVIDYDASNKSTISATDTPQATNDKDTYYLAIKGKNNYKGTKKATWTIDQAPVTVTADSKEFVFDNTAHTLTSSTFNFKGLSSLFNGICATFTRDGGVMQTNVGEYKNYKPNTDAAIVYTKAESNIINNKNFAFDTVEGTLKITGRPITADYGFTFTAEGDYYTAKAQDATPTVNYHYIAADGSTQEGTLVLGEDKDFVWFDDGTTYTHTQTDVAVDTYTARVKGVNNYALDGSVNTAKWNIKPLPVTITPKSVDVKYDGTKHYVDDFDVDKLLNDQVIKNKAHDSADVVYSNNIGVQNVYDENNGMNNISVASVKNIYESNGTTLVPARNYAFTSGTASVTITKRPLPDPDPEDPHPEPTPPTPPSEERMFNATDIETTYTGLLQTMTDSTIGNSGNPIVVTGRFTKEQAKDAVKLTAGTDYSISEYTGECNVPQTGSSNKYTCTNPAKDADTYYVRIEGMGNYSGYIVAKWTIVPATLNVQIEGASASAKYIKGVERSANKISGNTLGYIARCIDNSFASEYKATNLHYNGTDALTDAKGTKAGEYPSDPEFTSGELKEKFTYNDKNFDVNYTWNSGKLTITQKPEDDPDNPNDPDDPGDGSGRIIATGGSVVFKGDNYIVNDKDSMGEDNVLKVYQEYKDENGSVTKTLLEEGVDYEIDKDNSVWKAQNVGDYTVTVRGINNYKNSKPFEAIWHITKATVKATVDGNQGEFEFDGKEHTVSGVTLTGDPSQEKIFAGAGVTAVKDQSISAMHVTYNEKGEVDFIYKDVYTSEDYFTFNPQNIEKLELTAGQPLGIKINPHNDPDDPFTVNWSEAGKDHQLYDDYTYNMNNFKDDLVVTDVNNGYKLSSNDFIVTGEFEASEAYTEGETPGTPWKEYTINFKGAPLSDYADSEFQMKVDEKLVPLATQWYIDKRNIDDPSTYISLVEPLLRYTGEPLIQKIEYVHMDAIHEEKSADTDNQNIFSSFIAKAFADNTTRKLDVVYEYVPQPQIGPGIFELEVTGTGNYYNKKTKKYPIIDKEIPSEIRELVEFKVRCYDEGFSPASVDQTDTEAILIAGNLNDIADLATYALDYKQPGNFYGLYLDITDATSTISPTDKAEFEKKMAANNENLYQYLDLSINSTTTLVGEDGTSTTRERQIHNLNKEGDVFNINLNVPAAYTELVNNSASKKMSVYRIHDGALESVEYSFDKETSQISFTADKFSNYAFAYDATSGPQPGPQPEPQPGPGEDETGAAKTADTNGGVVAGLLGLMAAGATSAIIARRRKFNN